MLIATGRCQGLSVLEATTESSNDKKESNDACDRGVAALPGQLNSHLELGWDDLSVAKVITAVDYLISCYY